MHAPTPSPFALVGRDRELAIVRERLSAALAGNGGLVLIGGEAGIGKTALAEALCQEAAEQGALVLVGRCYDLTETPPYGPWVELFRHSQPTDTMPPLPEAFAQRGTVGEASSQSVLFQQTLDFLTALSTTRPLVLLLDDLHWADLTSLDLLRFLARAIPALPILAIVTYRADELTRRHPLYVLLPVLARESSAVRVDLQRLEQVDLQALITDRYALASAETQQLITYLSARSDGNPFFVEELLHTLEAARLIRRTDVGWALGDLSHVRIPMLLHQVIDGRLVRLGEETQQLLAMAAVIGQEVPVDLWMAVATTDEGALTASVERSIDAHVLEPLPDGSGVRFRHALIREALYERIIPTRRQTWHRRVGEVLIARSTPDPDAVAYHFGQAHDRRTAAWLIKAGERAYRTWAWPIARTRFEAALPLLDEADYTERGWLLLRLVRLNMYFRMDQGVAYSEEAARLARFTGDRLLGAQSRYVLGHCRYLRGEIQQGLAEMEPAITAMTALSGDERSRLDSLHPFPATDADFARGFVTECFAMLGRFTEAKALIERSGITLDEPAVPSFALAYWGLADVYVAAGQPGLAQRAYALAREALMARGNEVEAVLAMYYELREVALTYHTDDLPRRTSLADEMERLHIRTASTEPGMPLQHGRIPLMVVEGAWHEARSVGLALLAAVAVGDRHSVIVSNVHSVLGPVIREQGEGELAWEWVREALPGGPATAPGETLLFRNTLSMQRLAATLAIDARDFQRARQWLEAHDRWLDESGSVLGRAEGQLSWGQYHRAIGDLTRAWDHALRAFGHATDPRQPLALLAAHRLLGEIATATGRYTDATAQLEAALALADACAAPFERALTLLALAELHAAMDSPAEVAGCIDAVRAICEPLGARLVRDRTDLLATRLTAMRDTRPAYPAGLSPREVEVLRLIATGRSNREIADALFLSPGTVNVHVTHILAKTETANRTEAAAYAHRHGLA